jgi:hypothetical protein
VHPPNFTWYYITFLASDCIDLSSRIGAHEETATIIPSKTNGSETVIRTDRVIRVRDDISRGGRAVARGHGLAVSKVDNADLIPDGIISVPATVEADPGLRAIGVELDVQRCHMSMEHKTRCDPLRAKLVIIGIVLIIRRKLVAGNTVEVRKVNRLPSGEAVWISEILAQILTTSAIEVS